MRETFQEYTARMLALLAGDDPIAVLSATPARLERLVAGRTTAALQRRPAPGRWSVAQILSHLLDAEVVLAYRMRRILAAPGSAIEPYDQDSWVAASHAEASDGFESLSVFTALRGANVRWAGRLTEQECQRAGLHAERGPESIAHLLKLYAGHDRNHLAQIERILTDAAAGAALPNVTRAG